MKLIVGLGNPGEKYKKTRHNLGFMVVEELVQSAKFKIQSYDSRFKVENKFKAEILETECNNEKIILAKPMAYMNNSGLSISLISQYLNILVSDIWVIHDDLDLPLGSMKIKFGGGSAGHNGVESIIESLGTDKFWRFRIGIGTEKVQSSKFKVQSGGAEDYVLEEFGMEELEEVKKIIKKGSEAIQTALEKGMEAAMNKYNTR